MRSTTVTDTLIRDSRYTGKISTIRRRIVRDFPNVAGSEIYLQGYRGPDVGIDDFEDQNVTDIMELASNVDEPIYASKKPKRVDMSGSRIRTTQRSR